MERSYIKDVKEGKKVLIKGWIQEIRNVGKMKFLLLRDITGILQGIVVDKKLFDKVPSIESVVEIEGKIKSAKIKSGEVTRNDIEIDVEKIEVLSEAETLPIQVTEKTITTGLANRLDYRFIDIRKRGISAIFKIRSTIYKAVVDFFDKEGFLIINTPKLTTIGLESGAESFVVDYFGKKVVLAQSPQFYKQMFSVGGFERVMEIGPVYRAEKSHTTRHLTEFIGIDFEMGFIKDESDVMDVGEKMMKYIIEVVKKERKEELELLNVELKVPKKIPRISMSELKKILAKKGKELKEDDDLDAEAEKMAGEYALKEFGEEFIFVTNYPTKVRPFYHMHSANDPNGTRSFDLLWKGVEVCTGAQREHRLKILQKQAKEKGVKIPKIYEGIFKYGAMPHGGIGFGLDRITQRMLNLENTREAILLPRDTQRTTP